ncbi:MAG: ASPIC/UnbV domain-containing protein [Sedimentisphaerales bacterium]|nr:ASPIC/UnbV domain-containing protein [Sedimentisphaerales bacterium]
MAVVRLSIFSAGSSGATRAEPVFEERSRKLGLEPDNSAAAWADFDNDGDLDPATGGKLFVNRGNHNSWLKVKLIGDGKTVNRSAIGSQVRIMDNGRILTRQVESGTGEGNQNEIMLHFGLGSHSKPVNLEIFWAGGYRQKVNRIKPDQLITVTLDSQNAVARNPQK